MLDTQEKTIFKKLTFPDPFTFTAPLGEEEKEDRSRGNYLHVVSSLETSRPFHTLCFRRKREHKKQNTDEEERI